MNPIEVCVDLGGRLLTLQTGKLAKQSDGSILARYGETIVLVTVVSAREAKENQDFFPLTVDFLEKYYAAGRIPGGFFKREARPTDRATLSARLIDRPCRPLFPEDYLYETNVVCTVLSTDGENESDLLASIAASAALHISDIPFAGPVATCRVGMIGGEFIINPTPAQQAESRCELLVSGIRTGVVMVEGAAKELSEKEMIDAVDFAHKAMEPVFDLQDELRKKAGKPKREYTKPASDADLKKKLTKAAWPKLEKAFAVREKLARYEALAKVKKEIKAEFEVAEPKTKEEKATNGLVSTYFNEAKSEYARDLTLKKHRVDGRGNKDIRNIFCETSLLPRVHGSALFTRGETQVLGTVTLGTSDDEQKIDSINGSHQKTFMLHYNFPPYSVGEARPLRPPGRREIGHGFLAERALSYIIPSKDKFPYTVRIVSEVLESNGSSSMATVCSGSLALMDAGVPIAKPVAGVAMGLIKEGEKYAILSDILGDEDHLGDMDFKVCGTQDGITAFQMDLKIGGVSREIMEEALGQAREGRLHILEKMNEALAEPRTEFSPYAPRIFTVKVRPEKVREVIGSGGKVIRSIIERTGVKIDIEDDGNINIASSDSESAQKAIDIINQIVAEPEIGRVYEGKVTRIADFGAFVEILPGTDGLCHISELEHFRVRRVEDVVKEGEVIKVKCLDVDAQGKIRLSRKALLPKDGGDGGGGGGGRERAPEKPVPAEAAADAEVEEQAPSLLITADSIRPPEGARRDRGAADEEADEPSVRDEARSSRFGRDRGDRGDDRPRMGRASRGHGDRDSGRDGQREERAPRERSERGFEPRERFDRDSEARPGRPSRPEGERVERGERHARLERPSRGESSSDNREGWESRGPRSGRGDRDRPRSSRGERDGGRPRSDREGFDRGPDREPSRGMGRDSGRGMDRELGRGMDRDSGRGMDREPGRGRDDRFGGRSARGGRDSERVGREPERVGGRGRSDHYEEDDNRGNRIDRPDRSGGTGGYPRGPRSATAGRGVDREAPAGPRRSSAAGSRGGRGGGGRSSEGGSRRSSSAGAGRLPRFERADLGSRRDLRFDRDEERLPDFEPGSRGFADDDE